MKLVTQKQLIKNIVKYWDSYYGPFPKEEPKIRSFLTDYYFKPDHKGADGIFRSKVDIYNDLSELDLDSATVENVENIIGKGNLVRCFCSECHNEFKQVIEFDKDDFPYYVCEHCIEQSLKLITDANIFTLSSFRPNS